MARFGLIGGSYASQSPVADPEECVNWYVENIEGSGKSAQALYPTGGKKLFVTLPTKPVRGQFIIEGRVFAVGGNTLYEVFANGSVVNRGGPMNFDGNPVSMAASNQQLAVVSAGMLYVLTLATNAFMPVPGANFAGLLSQIDFSDGFFSASVRNSNQWQVSNLLDATTWNPLAVSLISVFADNIQSLIIDHRNVWIFGPKKTVVYQDVGAAIFPYAVIPGATIETGAVAQNSPTRLDNSVFWLSQDERGAGVVFRTSGYVGVRVSNHAMEYQIQQYKTITDAIGYSLQENGHLFYVLYFPTANVTWAYDVATGLWHKRLAWAQGQYTADLAQNHVYAFGQHLVGDWSSGNIYAVSDQYFTDNGNPIRRLRRAPIISAEEEWVFGNRLQFDVETGLGPQPPLYDGAGNPRDPQLIVSWSDDGGHNYGNETLLNCGQAGDFKARAITWRLGKFRNRSYQIVATDPIPWRIISGYFEGTGFQLPTKRLAAQYAEVS
jgi:hypothetical protein